MAKIVDLLSKNPKGLTLSEIADKTSMPRTTVFDIIYNLNKNDFLTLKNERKKNYVIGPKLYIYGTSYLQNSNIIQLAENLLIDIANKFGRTVFVTKSVDNYISYIYKYQPINAKVKTNEIGDLNYLHATAAGKCFLAFDQKIQSKLYDIELIKLTNFTLTSIDKLKVELETIRKNKYSFDNRESKEHILCVAAPIFGNNDEIIYAISLSGLYDEKEDYDMIGEYLVEESKKISKQLGYIKR